MIKIPRFLRSPSLIIIIAAAIVLELLFAQQSYYNRRLLGQELERHAEGELMSKVMMMKNMLGTTEQILLEHAWDIERSLPCADSMFHVTRRFIENSPSITGGCMGFVPYFYPEKGRLFEPYAHKENGVIKVTQLAHEGHDYTKNNAFHMALTEDTVFWSDPYQYGEPDNYLITYSYPFHTIKGDIAAVCGLDLSLAWLGDTINKQHVYPSSFVILLTKEGVLIAGPPKEHVKQKDIEQIVSLINDKSQKRRSSLTGKSEMLDFIDSEDASKAYIFITTLQDNSHWQVAVVCYDDEVYGKLYNARNSMTIFMLVGLLVLGGIIQLFIANQKRLSKASIEQERIGSELRVASNIQMNMLPEQSAQPLVRDDIDIVGSLAPAKEVGGDLYDYFVRDEKLYFCIGDVSGKGVPAALVMSVTHSYFRSAASHDSNPARIMRLINEAVCEGNTTNMFVTLFIGVLDLPTGRLRYCNAGHDAPIILSGETSGENVSLPVKSNLPVGVFTDFTFESQETQIDSDTTIFLYTDGLTEAKDKHSGQFGLKRVENVIGMYSSSAELLQPRKLLETMTQEVHRFTNGAEQSDDLTMLAIHYSKPEETVVLDRQITLVNDLNEVPRLNSFVKEIGAELQLDGKLTRKLMLAIEEAVVNVISYGYTTGTTGKVNVRTAAGKDKLKIVITDNGTPFDPTATANADTTLSAKDRPIGGLGILLVRQHMDSINYERTDGQNVLTLIKKL